MKIVCYEKGKARQVVHSELSKDLHDKLMEIKKLAGHRFRVEVHITQPEKARYKTSIQVHKLIGKQLWAHILYLKKEHDRFVIDTGSVLSSGIEQQSHNMDTINAIQRILGGREILGARTLKLAFSLK